MLLWLLLEIESRLAVSERINLLIPTVQGLKLSDAEVKSKTLIYALLVRPCCLLKLFFKSLV